MLAPHDDSEADEQPGVAQAAPVAVG